MQPTRAVTFGKSRHVFYTPYHAEQFSRALRLNGTEHTVEEIDRKAKQTAVATAERLRK